MRRGTWAELRIRLRIRRHRGGRGSRGYAYVAVWIGRASPGGPGAHGLPPNVAAGRLERPDPAHGERRGPRSRRSRPSWRRERVRMCGAALVLRSDQRVADGVDGGVTAGGNPNSLRQRVWQRPVSRARSGSRRRTSPRRVHAPPRRRGPHRSPRLGATPPTVSSRCMCVIVAKAPLPACSSASSRSQGIAPGSGASARSRTVPTTALPS